LLPALQQALAGWPARASAEPCLSRIGSGSLPIDRLPSFALVATPTSKRGGGLDRLEAGLRGLTIPVIGRIADGALRLDLRSLPVGREKAFVSQLGELADR
jgi:L-seryl-tRNA(Ser) seleniumtransferase